MLRLQRPEPVPMFSVTVGAHLPEPEVRWWLSYRLHDVGVLRWSGEDEDWLEVKE